MLIKESIIKVARTLKEGKESNDWKLVDAIDIIVHLFHPDKRSFYDLEKMWCDPINEKELLL